MEYLTKLRQEIDQIDSEIIVLFERRMKIAKKVALFKKEKGLPIYDEVREKEVIEKNIERLKDKDLIEELEEFYNTIFKLSKRIQKIVLDEHRK